VTIQIRGREYRVETKDDTNGRPRYHLHGVRGAHYFTMRTDPKPELMFICDGRGFGLAKVMDGVWLTDEGGDLRVRGE
jgi:hypothetical protein